MYRVMLIDDDKAIREHLKEIIPWDKLGLFLAAEAAQGEEARDCFAQEEPHIVITDINIPLIDGIELSRRFVQKERDTQIILITGYGSLDYAREAIKAGTVDFLLKPIEHRELLAALEKAVGNLNRKTEELSKLRRMEEILRENLPILQERYFLELLAGVEETEEEIAGHLEKLNFKITGRYFQVGALIPDFGKMKVADKEVFQFVLQNMVEELGAEYGVGCRVFWKGFSEGAVFFQYRDKDTETGEKLMMRVRDKLQTYSRYDFQVGIGYLTDSLKGLPESENSALQALDYSSVYARNHVTLIDNVLVLEEQEPLGLEREMEEIVRYAGTEGILDFRKALGNYMNRLLIASKGSFSCIQKECIKLLAELLAAMPQVRWDTEKCFAQDPYLTLLGCREPLELQACFLEVRRTMQEYRQSQSRNKGRRVIEKAKSYIEEHYRDENLNLSRVSEAIGLSVVYFCSLFKEETGMTFVEYLNQVRIRQAKVLLKEGKMKIYQVALETGYSNPSYFYEVFKKLTGKRPREYAEGRDF